MIRIYKWVFVTLAILHFITGCGQSGKLYLPNQNPPEVSVETDDPPLEDA